MPQVFKVGSYWIYFWANEGKPNEPVHVHVSEGESMRECDKDLDNIKWELFACA